jgi:hypothetical protein
MGPDFSLALIPFTDIPAFYCKKSGYNRVAGF